MRSILLPLALLSMITVGFAAQAGSGSSQSNDPQFGQRRNDVDPHEVAAERKRAKALNANRHESLRTDTDKLLELATQLKEQVDKSSENTLSLEVIKKAEEIEKLAKKVRTKMRGH